MRNGPDTRHIQKSPPPKGSTFASCEPGICALHPFVLCARLGGALLKKRLQDFQSQLHQDSFDLRGYWNLLVSPVNAGTFQSAVVCSLWIQNVIFEGTQAVFELACSLQVASLADDIL